MNRSSRDGVTYSETYTIDCYHCGLVAQCPLTDVTPTAARHYANVHPGTPPVVGLNYKSYLSPQRCDTCNDAVELPYWEHRSYPRTSVGLSVDSDGRWLTCRICHGYWKRQDINGWIRYRIAMAVSQTRLLERQSDIVEVMTRETRVRFGLLIRRWDVGVMQTKAKPIPQAEPPVTDG